MPDNASQIFELISHAVFYCSLASLVLAAVERSVQKFYPNSGAERVIAFIADLVSQFGALNLRDKIAPREAKREVWSEEQRAAAKEKEK